MKEDVVKAILDDGKQVVDTFFVARNSRGGLNLFTRKPIRDREFDAWGKSAGEYCDEDFSFELNRDAFSDLQWSDGPLEVKLVLVEKQEKNHEIKHGGVMQVTFKWETIAENTYRAKVIGGWIVVHGSQRNTTLGALSQPESMSFVFDPFHWWEAEQVKE